MASRAAKPRRRSEAALTHARDYAGIGEKWARDAVAGRIMACRWVKLACKRHLDDLDRARQDPAWGYEFSAWHADDVCDFIEKLEHVEGTWETPNIRLHPAQIFILTTIFGWRRIEDGGRRFSYVYIEMARKGAKSALTAGVSLYCLTCEGEVGPQIIIGASTGLQAKNVFNPAKKMVDKSAALREAFDLSTWANAVTCAQSDGTLKTINAKGSSQDGHNPHLVVLDELHAHIDRALFDVMKSAQGARNNPLFWIITTAGFSTSGVCYEQRTYMTKVLQGIFGDDSDHAFGIIFTIDDAELAPDGSVITPADDPLDPNVWVKANPLLNDTPGSTPSMKFLRSQAADAKASPTAMGDFKTKHLNIWLNSATAWLNMERWRECADPSLDWSEFEGLDCYVGLDLADKDDITALVLAALDANGRLLMKSKFWLPSAVLEDAKHAQGSGPAPYRTWSEQGHLQLTPGDFVDHNEIETQLRDWIARFSPRRIVFDPWGAAQAMVSKLNTDLATPDNPLAYVLPKNAKNFTDPSKELEARVKAGPDYLRHDGNPVMDWMASNAVVSRRLDGTILPKKDRPDSANKIDGIDAAITAIQPILTFQSEPTMPVYEIRPMRFI